MQTRAVVGMTEHRELAGMGEEAQQQRLLQIGTAGEDLEVGLPALGPRSSDEVGTPAAVLLVIEVLEQPQVCSESLISSGHDSPLRYGADWSTMNGAAGGPSTVRIPGGLGMLSPIRTSPLPATVTPVLASGPITSGYGTPQTELTIKQMEPAVARGMPFAAMNGGRIIKTVPESGGPEAPGLTITIAPIVTGDPGIRGSFLRR